MAHPSAFVDEPSTIGQGTVIWHFVHVMAGARIGPDCTIGQGVFIASTAVLGRGVKVQNNVSIYDGVVIEDDVFIGPSAVFTNVKRPRAEAPQRGRWQATTLARGSTIGANATIVCGVRIGVHAFVAAGAVVTRDVADHALVAGMPARRKGWVSSLGVPLVPKAGLFVCPEDGGAYREVDGRLLQERKS